MTNGRRTARQLPAGQQNHEVMKYNVCIEHVNTQINALSEPRRHTASKCNPVKTGSLTASNSVIRRSVQEMPQARFVPHSAAETVKVTAHEFPSFNLENAPLRKNDQRLQQDSTKDDAP
jgi:hypothetical protein